MLKMKIEDCCCIVVLQIPYRDISLTRREYLMIFSGEAARLLLERGRGKLRKLKFINISLTGGEVGENVY